MGMKGGEKEEKSCLSERFCKEKKIRPTKVTKMKKKKH
jgi:hypothetical protein